MKKMKEVKKLIINKSKGINSKGVRALPRKYLSFPDKEFGIWVAGDRFYIGNKSNELIIDGNNLIINNEPYKETHVFGSF